MKTFSNRSNAKRAISQFRDKFPDLATSVEFQVVATDGDKQKLVATVFNDVRQGERDEIAKIAEIAAPVISPSWNAAAMPAFLGGPVELDAAKESSEMTEDDKAEILKDVDPTKVAAADEIVTEAPEVTLAKAEAAFQKAEKAAQRKADKERQAAERAAKSAAKQAAIEKGRADRKAAAETKAASKVAKAQVTKERRAVSKAAKAAGEKGPTGMTAQLLDLAARENGVSAKELFELSNWHGAPWKWNFSNPQGTGWCDKYGYGFEVLGDRKTGVRYKITRSAA